MRYWQMRAARLSTASQKLEADGQWHSMRETPHAWYRVGKGRIVQRVNFESDLEEHTLLPKIETLDPLPEMATVTGFREELRMKLESDNVFVILPLGYAPSTLDTLSAALEEYGIELRNEGALLYAFVPVVDVTRDELIHSQHVLTAVRLLFQALSASSAEAAIAAAIRAFRTAIEEH
jgi:hypothetical protein